MKLGVFILGGVILIGAGIVQALLRPPPGEGRGAGRFAGTAVIRGVFFVIVGVLAVLVGLGIIPIMPMRL
jgi:hypothetical protein